MGITKKNHPPQVTSERLPSVAYNGITYRPIREGKAVILAPEGAKVGETTDEHEAQKVFYNPIQQFNRDLTVLAIKAFGEDFLEERADKAKASRERQQANKKRKRGDVEDEAAREGAGGEGAGREGAARANSAEEETSGGQGQSGKGEVGAAETIANDGARGATETPDAQRAQPAQPAQEEPRTARTPVQQAEPSDHTSATQRGPKFTILDALSASGLRALRYAHEIPFVSSVTANDITASAVASIILNVSHNNLAHKVVATNEDALAHMYRVIAQDLSRRDFRGRPSETNRYTVVDLDPYGTAAPFFDAALQSVKDGGLVCVTCTDASIWASHGYCEKAFSLYGGIPVKGAHSHEAGLRLVLHALASTAARYGLTIEPLLSLSIDFYCRVFVRVRKSQVSAKFLASKTMMVYNCDHGCGSWDVQYLMKNKLVETKKGNAYFYKHSMSQGPTAGTACRHCGNQKMHISGPMFGGYIHSPEFVQRILDSLPGCDPEVYGTLGRMEGMLRTALEEVQPLPEPPEEVNIEPAEAVSRFFSAVDPTPFFVSPSKLSATVCCETPGEDMFRGALKHLGYISQRSHCKRASVKTDAPWEDIWWIMREWVRRCAPVKAGNIKPHHPAWRILGEDVINGTAKAAEDVEMEDDSGGESRTTGHGGATDTGNGAREGEETVAVEDAVDDGEAKTPEERKRTLVFNRALERRGRQVGAKRLVRYQHNPRPNWGPINKAVGR